VAMLGFLLTQGVSLPRLLAVTIPATFLGVVIGSLSVAWRGKDLDADPEYQKRLATGEVKTPPPPVAIVGKNLFRARGSMLLFMLGIVAVVLIGMFPNLRPAYEVVGSDIAETDQVSMGMAIMIVMIAVSGLIMIVFKASPEAALKGTIMRSGITAIICILGISWLGSSFFEGNRNFIVGSISNILQVYPWTFSIGMFVLSTMLFSQAATVAILMPLGVALKLPASTLAALYPAANGIFFLPTYGTLLAAVSFDQTGTTKIGKYLLNHSFMLPGLVTIISTIAIALLLSNIVN
jgi:anaerobic C4-dicarboxylate transporter